MRASIHADGKTFHLRCTSGPAGTEDPDGKGELEGVPHRDVAGVETTAETATGGYENYLSRLSGPKFLHDFVEQGEWGKHTCTLTSPASPKTKHPPLGLLAPELET